MRYLIKYNFLLLSFLILTGHIALAQNINTPNKTGPMGTQVNTSTGNLFIPRNDIYVPARGFDINLSFYYNSFDFDTSVGFGKGWSCNYRIQYKNDTANGKIIVWGDDREDAYKFSGGAYKAPAGFFNTLTQYQPGKYLLTELDGTQFYFDNPVHRKITKLIGPNGNFINFNYTDTLLTSIVNKAGQSVSFTYNSSGNLATVTDAITAPVRTYTYTYDSYGNLTKATDPLNGTMKYAYLVNGPMKTMSDKNDNTIDIIYYPDYTVKEIIGCNKRQSYSYDTATLLTIVTDYLANGNNQVTKYQYQRVNDIVWLKRLSGNCCGFNMQFEFDADGNKIKETDANGNVYRYSYDNKGNLIKSTNPLNQSVTYTYGSIYNKLAAYTDYKGNLYSLSYDSKGNLIQLSEPGNLNYTATYNTDGDIISSTDAKGNTYSYNYDSYGNPTTVTGPNGYSATLAVDPRGNLLSFKDGRNNTSIFQYDILNRLKTITDPINQSVQVSYDGEGNIISMKNPNNETSNFSYDASNRLVKSTDAIGNKTLLTYDAMDNLTEVLNAVGDKATLSYDNLNRVNGGRDAAGNAFSIEYDGNGNITSVSLPNGLTRSFTYDQLDRVLAVTDNIGTNGSLQYDPNGNITKMTDASGAITTAAYDNLNRLKSITDPLGNSFLINYDNNGLVTSVTDRNGNTSNYTYDSSNRVKTYTDAIGGIIAIGYDAEGNIISLKDQNNNTTLYTYDSLNRYKRITYPDGKFLEYTYDRKSNIIAKKLADGSTIQFQYDSVNRPVTKILPDGHIFTYTYDAIGRIKTATNNTGTVTFTYDNLNRLTSENFDGKTTRYSYDIANRTQTTIYPDSTIIVKIFDKRNNLISVSKNGRSLVAMTYNNANLLTSKTFANGVTTNYQYDIANRLTNITTGNGIQNSSFTYDKEGNKKTIIRNNNPSQSEEFGYDATYRMISYKKGIIGGSPVVSNTYVYDLPGNRISANLNGIATSYSSNSLNQLINLNNGSQNINFTYDSNGNQAYNGGFYKKYDAEGRLQSDSASPANKISYQYDALGRRIRKTAGSNIYKYGYSGVSQVILRDGNTDTILTRSVFANFIMPLYNEKSNQGFYYHPNELGSVEGISNKFGNAVENYQYDPYGKSGITDSAGNSISSSATGNRFGFTGQELDAETNDYHFYFRNYNTTTGTFYQRDLIGYGDGMGMYQYVGNNPANGVDVMGLKLKPCGDKNKSSTNTGSLEDDIEKGETFLANGLTTSSLYIDHVEIPGLDKSWKKIVELEKKIMEMGKKGEDLLDALSKVKKGSAEYEAMLGKLNKGLGITGKAVGLLDNAIKAHKLKTVINDPKSTPNDIRKASANLALSFLGHTSPGAIYGLIDLVVEQGSGKNLVEHSDYAGTFYGNLYSHVMYGVPMDYGDPNAKPAPDARGWKVTPLCPQNKTIGGKRYRRYWLYDAKGDSTEAIAALDPNEIIGPIGQPTKKWVSVNDRMPYTITYENSRSASAPAKYVKITAPIQPKQDAASFQLGSFNFNSLSFNVPTGAASYYNRLDCRDSLGLYVDVTAGYDVINTEAFWEFQSIDPVTLLPPTNPLVGFLLLQDSTKPSSGHGLVNFSIKPKVNAVTLDTIVANAKIIFDSNDTIPTNNYKNTIDAFPPVSHMNAVPSASPNPVSLSWTGTDDPGGCGVRSYTLYVSTNGVSFYILRSGITRTDTTLTLAPDSSYCFFVLATDSVGNTEQMRPGEIKCLTVSSGPLPVTWLYFKGNNQGKDNQLEWATSSEQNSKEFKLERSLTGNQFTPIATIPASGNSSTTRVYPYKDVNIDRLNSSVFFYRVKQIDLNGNFVYSNTVRLNYNQKEAPKSIVYPNPTQGLITVTVGERTLIGTTATVTDINGRILQQVKIIAQSQSFNFSNLANGTYFIRLANKEVMKIVKQ